jgi:NAD(P)-dependent dehydrogenase (short-subunit alcohol dehydrogenase family)
MKQGRLAGKVAILTGAAPQGPGIGNGSAVAILFAREGAQVVLVNWSEQHARALQRTIEDEGGDCTVCLADVTRASEAERLVETTIQRYGKLDILHNNVGGIAGSGSRMVELTEDAWDRCMAVNLKSMMLCCKYSIPRMLEEVESPLIVAVQGEEVLEKRRRAIPLQTAGTGWDVGWAAVYLASDESRWVTGIELPIDGGQLRILERPR